MRIPKPSLHVTILTLFLSFLFITAGSLTWYNFHKNSQAAISIADELLSQVSKDVSRRIEELFISTIHMTNEVAELSELVVKPDFMSHPSQWFLAEALLAHPQLYSVYIGYADGDFYQIISLRQEEVRELLSVPMGAELAIRRVFERPLDGRRIELWQFFDEERRLVGSRSISHSTYDPRNRPWFQRAIRREGVINTPFYVFTSTGSMGMTFAHRFDGPVPGVFGVDITLSELSGYFAEQKVGTSGYVFMFNRELEIMAHPDPEKVLMVTETPTGKRAVRLSLRDDMDPLMSALAERMEQAPSSYGTMTLSAGGTQYLVRLSALTTDFLNDQLLATVAPMADFTGTISNTRRKSLIFAAIIILLAIPVAMYNARVMSTSLNQLAKEADKIRRFELDSDVEVHSHISEIAGLAVAVKTMRASLASFGRYVPKTLVKRFLLADTNPRLGGERRESTLLFTDIEGFTAIAEQLNAEELMVIMSEYLQILTSVIHDNGGTIDKYIGDAIMAFWNAPDRQPDHAKLACEAALKAWEASEELNGRLRKRGLPEMRTRFGIHLGRPIIGNVGSDDRMNYTAMGAPVNLAARLEGLNKYYSTQILVSETVMKKAEDDFVFRPVGKVIPKGVLAPISIYELMGRASDTSDLGDTLFQRKTLWEKGYHLYQGRRFDDAVFFFEKWVEENPEDQLAVTMLHSSRERFASPPGEDWNGVDVFKVK